MGFHTVDESAAIALKIIKKVGDIFTLNLGMLITLANILHRILSWKLPEIPLSMFLKIIAEIAPLQYRVSILII